MAKTRVWILSVGGILLVAGACTMALFVWAQQYQGRFAPSVRIAGIDVQGLDQESARIRLQKRIDTLLTDGYPILWDGETYELPLSTLVGTDNIDDVDFRLEEALQRAAVKNRHTNPILDAVTLAMAKVSGRTVDVPIPVTLHEDALRNACKRLLPDAEQETKNASYQFTYKNGLWDVTVVPEQPGRIMDLSPFFAALRLQLEHLRVTPIRIQAVTETPAVTRADAERAKNSALLFLNHTPISLLTSEEEPAVLGSLTAWDLTKLLRPTETPASPLTLDTEAFIAFLEPLLSSVTKEPTNASLRIEGNRVVEFVPGEEGVELDTLAAKALVLEALASEQKTVQIPVVATKPKVTVGDLNDLGIKEELGVGTSSYRGSPQNRIRNIRNGVKLLDGILIAPGDTFSLLSALRPFTEENGYRPELVIKGDKIEPELGGGLCQIGTTTFRATMNSGLPVVERRNHSLVVSYYNDPLNGAPGTDATIYEPAPDFKFLNDTDHYLMFKAEILETKQRLRFSFWGTPDGRKGSYTPPLVTRWIPVGEPKIIETEDLAPGEEKCQSEHIGADAYFTYTIERPDGTITEETFTSHYRPLPEICLVGKDPNAPLTPEGTVLPNEAIFEAIDAAGN